MAERVDVLEASHEALKTELAETERQIQGCYQRAEKLRTALEALQGLLGDESVIELQTAAGADDVADDGSVTKVMDKLQEDDGDKSKGKDSKKEEEQTPVWLEKKEA